MLAFMLDLQLAWNFIGSHSSSSASWQYPRPCSWDIDDGDDDDGGSGRVTGNAHEGSRCTSTLLVIHPQLRVRVLSTRTVECSYS